jgi:hypothetical protein
MSINGIVSNILRYFHSPNRYTNFRTECIKLSYPTAGLCRIARELWWTNQELYPVDIIRLSFSMLMTLGVKNITVGGSSSET